ncbi:hypothetical protein [Paenibacillus sp. MMS20-IR301]|uniref:hypothetical protein n=1 Tax=Paenibacillus sp. MMS20-IR301 TaxID=2895946 RepID=UPI0028E811CE|nr:hypothetical protein [Paenibacillus sp. MMS20-IR301]WNS43292.1 hypothetical protein LOS79_30875 [Paenibacillus sp. MMS20-IR301]
MNSKWVLGRAESLLEYGACDRRRIDSCVHVRFGESVGEGGKAEASKMYDSIRASTSDVQGISKNTGIAESRIQRIKDHVFNNEHIKSNGYGKNL